MRHTSEEYASMNLLKVESIYGLFPITSERVPLSTQFRLLSLFVISFSLFLQSISYSQVAEDTFTGETLDDAAVDEAGELPEEIPPPPEEPPLSHPPNKRGLQAITVQQQLERLGETPPTPKSKFEPPTMASPEIKPTPKLEIPPTAGEPDIAPLPLPEPTIVRQVPLP